MATREEVYAAIDSERAYQDAQKGNSKRHDGQPQMSPGEFILVLEHLLLQARTEWYRPDGGVSCLEHIRKVAGSATQCMEVHGAPPRK